MGSETVLVIIVALCICFLSAMTGIVGGYFYLAGKFSGDASIIEDLVSAVSTPEPGPVAVAPAGSAKSAAPEAAYDPATAPTLAPDALPEMSAPPVARPSQGDLSLDDFFTDFSVDAVNMSGDIPNLNETAANTESGTTGDIPGSSKRPKTENVESSQVLSETVPEGI